jgi:hypothetical protein
LSLEEPNDEENNGRDVDSESSDDEQNFMKIERDPIDRLIERVPIVLSVTSVDILWEVTAVIRIEDGHFHESIVWIFV